MRKREAIQPRNVLKAKADAFSFAAGSNGQSIAQDWTDFVGVQERGERASVV
jgi:hypothetical protein